MGVTADNVHTAQQIQASVLHSSWGQLDKLGIRRIWCRNAPPREVLGPRGPVAMPPFLGGCLCPRRHSEGSNGATMQSQQRPGEVRGMELVKWDHPEDSVLTASDSCHEQPHWQRLPTWDGRGHQLTSPHSTPFKDRELGAAQRPRLWPQGPLAALHWRGQTPHLGLNLASSLLRHDLG